MRIIAVVVASFIASACATTPASPPQTPEESAQSVQGDVLTIGSPAPQWPPYWAQCWSELGSAAVGVWNPDERERACDEALAAVAAGLVPSVDMGLPVAWPEGSHPPRSLAPAGRRAVPVTNGLPLGTEYLDADGQPLDYKEWR